ncbi:MAG: hypothetical protein ACTSVI_02700 [Promethearchaeota archaeon]
MQRASRRTRINLNLLCKYPFLNAARDWVRDKNLDPVNVFYDHPELLDMIREIFNDALDNKESSEGLSHENENSIIAYPMIRIILAFLNIPQATFKIANLYSKFHGKQMMKEDDQTIQIICFDQGINIKKLNAEDAIIINDVASDYIIKIIDYLRFARSFMASPWKLVNQLVKSGFVYLRKEKIVRIIQESIKKKIIDIDPKDEKIKGLMKIFLADPLLKSFLDGIKATCYSKITESVTELTTVPADESLYPPCINAILFKSSKGENLAHSERLFLTYFLLAVGIGVDDIVEIFRNQPDFKEDITRYQVEFAAGMQGKRTKYKPHNCSTLQSLGICKKLDPKFTNRDCTHPRYEFKNPITLYNRRLRYKMKKEGKKIKKQDESKDKKE